MRQRRRELARKRVQWYRIKKTYEKPQGGFLVVGARYPGVLSDDGVVVLFTHPGDAQWTEVVPVERGAVSEAAQGGRRRRAVRQVPLCAVAGAGVWAEN